MALKVMAKVVTTTLAGFGQFSTDPPGACVAPWMCARLAQITIKGSKRLRVFQPFSGVGLDPACQTVQSGAALAVPFW
jgi:hypothetical protein